MQKSQHSGFTLMEIMIAVAIIGIIAAIALPSYKQYVVRNNRVAVQAEMMQIANSLERFRSQQLTYKNAALLSLYGATKYPKTGNALYSLDLQVATNGITWVLLATPASVGKVQVGDGALKINNAGERCWNKASDTDCTLGAADQSWTSK